MQRKDFRTKYEIFQSRHPKLHIMNALALLLFPACLVGISFLLFQPMEDRVVLGLYALIGAGAVGIGLMLWTTTFYDKDVFFRFHIYPIGIGGIIVIVNLFGAYSRIIDLEKTVLEFQLVSYLLIFFLLLDYLVCREAITDHILAKAHLNEIGQDKRKEGFWNRLWYHKIHKEFGIGWIYYLNLCYSVVLILFLAATVSLIIYKPLAVVAAFLSGVAVVLSVVLIVFKMISMVRYKKTYYKTGRRSVFRNIPFFLEFGTIGFTLLLLFLQIKLFIAI